MSEELWLAAAARALKGAPLDSLTSRGVDGLEIEPLYGPGPPPRSAPLFRRGPAWDVRVRIDQPDPARANALALEALQGGATSLLLADPSSQAALDRALEGVVLEAAPVALEAGLAG